MVTDHLLSAGLWATRKSHALDEFFPGHAFTNTATNISGSLPGGCHRDNVSRFTTGVG
jgi:hypothetical protein